MRVQGHSKLEIEETLSSITASRLLIWFYAFFSMCHCFYLATVYSHHMLFHIKVSCILIDEAYYIYDKNQSGILFQSLAHLTKEDSCLLKDSFPVH